MQPQEYAAHLLQRPYLEPAEYRSLMLKALHQEIDSEQQEAIRIAGLRAGTGVPQWQQDLPFKLIKLNELNSSNWHSTDTVAAVHKYLNKK